MRETQNPGIISDEILLKKVNLTSQPDCFGCAWVVRSSVRVTSPEPKPKLRPAGVQTLASQAIRVERYREVRKRDICNQLYLG